MTSERRTELSRLTTDVPKNRPIRLTAGELVQLAAAPKAPEALRVAAGRLNDPDYAGTTCFACAGDIAAALGGASDAAE